LILKRLFGNKKSGFYVDVGAHHPQRYSNTYIFYQLGWRGINIDPMPGSSQKFDKLRPRDINLEIGVSTTKGELNYYRFNDAALNSFDKELSLSRDRQSHFVLKDCIKVKVDTLKDILAEHSPEGQTIDIMSVDVEGHDLQVLQSNDWDKYRPKCILVESISSSLTDIKKCPIYQFLTSNGYEIYAKTVLTYIYTNKTFVYEWS
jgi:FkbM family methyltransferase